jgi:glycine/D-amino acid oxidase-like deaminating enzyme/nitrite reductase/ring-hydroxylating ferredoxin subunit
MSFEVNREHTESYWMKTGEQFDQPPVGQDLTVDVCIIGAGIAGMTTAYRLLGEGKSVVVIDDGPIGGGQTQRTTAHLSNAIDDRYIHIEKWHGADGARLACESHSAAIEYIQEIVAREKIDCDFERLDGYLFNSPDVSQDLLEEELQAARRAGLTDVELVSRCPLQGFETGASLRFPRQGQFHPMKYLAGLRRAIEAKGGRIYSQTRAEKIVSGHPARVLTNRGHELIAEAVVVTTNTPFNDWVTIHTKQAAYISYVLGFAVPRGSVPKALYWDTSDPYHYVRLQSLAETDSANQTTSYDLLIVGGEDHKTGQADDADQRYQKLTEWCRQMFPMAGEILYRWSGQVFETIDGLAFIGRNPLDEKNIFVATGDSGQGMTHGTIAGLLLTDLILERPNPWENLYAPNRKTISAADNFLKENLNVALQYGSWLTGGEVQSVEQIAPGEGAVVRDGLSKIAAYRDQAGVLHQQTAVCPHLGCIVEWNKNERTWDCPCHGSRFDKLGHLICGPANSDLEPIKQKSTERVNKDCCQ